MLGLKSFKNISPSLSVIGTIQRKLDLYPSATSFGVVLSGDGTSVGEDNLAHNCQAKSASTGQK